MAQQAITLKIAGKSYSLNIESEKEEVYRLAEREVNNYLAAIKQNNFKNWTDQDYLSMAALKFAIANVDMRQSRELGDEDLKHLGRLGEELDAYLNTLQRSRERPGTGFARANRKKRGSLTYEGKIYPHRFLTALRN